MDFIGRKEELQIIEESLNFKEFSAVLIYGRRRIGKTELITKALEKRKEKIIFFTALKTTYKANIEELSNLISQTFNIEIYFKDLRAILDFISEKSKNEKIIFIIDEYSFFRTEKDATDSLIQLFIDKNIHNSNLKLILSGSLIDIMKGIIEKSEPLYGRFHAVLDLKPFNYYEASFFYPERSNEEKVILYSVFGGVPHYISYIDPNISVDENIIKLVFSKNSFLQSEIEILLGGELSKVESANAVISFIQSSAKSYKDINQFLSAGKNGNGATYILNKLVNLDLLEKEIKINTDEKKVLYRIKDNFLMFYYSLVLPYKTRFVQLSPKILYEEFVKDVLYNTYVPLRFERICQEFLLRRNAVGKISPIFSEIGKYTYHKKGINYEFDIVTKDKKGLICYECKYQDKPISGYVIREKMNQILNSEIPFYRLGFFSKKGFIDIEKKEEYIYYSLEDIYE